MNNSVQNSTSAAVQHRQALKLVFGLTVAYLAIEVVAGILTNSLALLADAGHMLTDAGSLALALFAVRMSQKPPTAEKTYGYYRVEILAALVNAVVLCLVSIFIFYHAFLRLQDTPAVIGLPMLLVAIAGLVINGIGVWKLHQGADKSLNVRGAFLEVLSDTLGSLGVIIAAIVMMTTGWYQIDAVVSILIGLFILPRTWKLLTRSVNVLLEATPEHIDSQEIKNTLHGMKEVASVHDLHIWTITSGFVALSAHLVLSSKSDSHQQEILEETRKLLKEKFNIEHITIQIEYRDLSEEERSV